jgi:sulfur-oxidizing protein SoxY
MSRTDQRTTIDRRRRELIRHATLAAAWLACGIPIDEARAAPGSPFDATLMADVLRSLGSTPIPSAAIDLDLPELTENGAMVPVAVMSRLPRTEQILLLAEANPFPLVALFGIAPGTEPYISTRVKLAQTCTVHAIVKSDGRFYSVTKNTAVITGGCGG